MNCVPQQEKWLRRFVLFVAAMVAFSLAGATPLLAQCDSWTGGGGDPNWSDAANWSTGKVPGSSDSACIQKSGAAVILDVSDDIAGLTVGSSDSLTLPSVTNASPSLNINGSSLANSGQIILSPPVSFGAMCLSFSSSGTATLSGRGTITLNANSFGTDCIGGGAKLLNRSTIQGAGGFSMTFNNASAGVINANEPGFQLVVGRNQSQGASTNTGLMEATHGGQMAIGSIQLNNVGGTIAASGTGSYVIFADEGQGGQTITGGTFTSSSGGVIYAYSGNTTIDGTTSTVNNKGTLAIPGNGLPYFHGTMNNTGTFQILANSNGGAMLNIGNSQTFTLSGSGNLTMGDGTSNSYNNQNYISDGGTFVNQQLVQGTGGILNLTGFNNSSTINANIPSGTNNLILQLGRAGASTNTGTIEATNGGVLQIGSTTINNVGGTIMASGTNSNVQLVGSLGGSGLIITGGTYTSSGGVVIYGNGGSLLDGTTNAVTNSGAMIINYGDLQVQGTMNNTGTMQILAPTNDNGQTFLQIPNGENLTLTGSGKVIMGDGTDNAYNNNAEIGNNFGTNGTFDNRSTIEGTGGIVLTQDVINDGTILANVPAGNSGLMLLIDRVSNSQNNGTIQATKGGVFYIGGGSCCGNPFTNAGTMIADANSTVNLQNANPFGNLANGILTGGTYNVTGTLQIPGNITTNDARITLNGKASQILNPNTNALTGFVTNASKGSFALKGGQNFTSAGTFTNQGAIGVGKGSTFTVGSGGSYVQMSGKTTVNGKLTLSSSEDKTDETSFDSAPAAAGIRIAKGSLFGNGGNIAAHVASSGTIVPADSMTAVGKLKITGAYTQGPAGALDANIAGANSGQFNVLNVTGIATLNGTLNIKLLNNFVPLVGAEFEILTARAVKGVFAKVNGLVINNSEHFTVTYNADNVTLNVVSGP